MSKYRCSACNEIKKIKGNSVYKQWNQRKKPENSEVVVICRKCNNNMRREGFIGVLQYLKRR